jgi:cation diffusion facilitator family transporter
MKDTKRQSIGMGKDSSRNDAANRVTWVGFFVNLVLTGLKMVAGVIGHSGAMIADAVHSLSDFATDIVVLMSFRLVGKPPDKCHDYGHGKYETLATAVIGIALLLVAGGIFWSGAEKVIDILNGNPIEPPQLIALCAAVVSIVVKEWLYRFTVKVGKRIESSAVIANAWHHRSDAFSSIATMLGIGGAMFLGGKWCLLDPLAAVAVSFFIGKVALEITRGSLKELTEVSLDDATETEILELVSRTPGAETPHDLRTRRLGCDVAIELHVCVDAEMRVLEAHSIASRIEDDIRKRFGASAFVIVHIEPLSDETGDSNEKRESLWNSN